MKLKFENLTLQDMSRDELLRLVQRFYLPPEAEHLRQVRRETLNLKAQKLADEALAEMDANMGGDMASLRKYLRAGRKADRAHRLFREINESWK